MPTQDLSLVVTLLSVCLGLLVILLPVAFGHRRRLARIERLLAAKDAPKQVIATSVSEDPSPGGQFETFLSEDPARKLLSKKEQAAAYRKWRQERGMNWSNS